MANVTRAASGVKATPSVWISEEGHNSAYRNLLAIRALGEVFESGASENMDIGAIIEIGSLIVRMANEASSSIVGPVGGMA